MLFSTPVSTLIKDIAPEETEFFLHTIPAILKNLSINADVEGIFCTIAYKDFILVIFSPYFVKNSFDDLIFLANRNNC